MEAGTIPARALAQHLVLLARLPYRPTRCGHCCVDCSDPAQRAFDPIYQRDAQALPVLEAGWERMIERERARAATVAQSGPWSLGEVLVAGFLVGLGLRALFKK
jgi:hypothetical protein